MNSLRKHKTLSQVLEFRKNSTRGITFIEGSEKENFLSYQDLYHKAVARLSYLQKQGIKPQNELVFQVNDNEAFIVLFWACILGGIIPVPLSIGRNSEHKQKLFNVWSILKNPYLAISKEEINKLNNHDKEEELAEIKQKIIDVKGEWNSGEDAVLYEAKEDDIAFIQFSSGSTGNPKGVVLTHKNLLTNIFDISTASSYAEEDSMISWMPLTHDMGLIGFHLNPLFIGMNHYLMPTDLFVRRPSIWLDKASEHQVTILCSPNFGYKYVLKHCNVDTSEQWDLNSVRLIYNGAEPISETICNQFLEGLSKYGLKKSAMCPVYGLAEASLAVTISNLEDTIVSFNFDRDQLKIGDKVHITEAQEKNSVSFVKVGKPINHCSLRITNDTNELVKDEVIGHIQIKGPNVTSGYYNNEEATKNAVLESGWVKTGDLGFVKDGELYVTGRLKDIIFSNGQNYYPHDIERIAEKVEGIELNKIAFGGFFNGNTQKEEIIAFVFHRGSLDKFIPIITALKEVVNAEIGLEINSVVPIKNVPKTTSGKLQRFKLLSDYRNGVFNEINEQIKFLISERNLDNIVVPANEKERKLLAIWKNVLDFENISVEKSFFELGGNSLKAAEMMMALVKEFQVEITPDVLYKYQTIRGLASVLTTLKPKEYKAIPKAESSNFYPVSSAQKRLYYAWKMNKKSIAYNTPTAFRIQGRINEEKLKKVISELVNKHDALRMVFDERPNPVFNTDKINEVSITIKNCEGSNIQSELRRLVMPFDLAKGPLFRMAILNSENNDAILFLDFHHIISDGVSIHHFVKEMISQYEGKIVEPLSIGYGDYSNWENNHKDEEVLTSNKSYWLDQLSGDLPELNIELDYPRPPIFTPKGEKLEFEFDNHTTLKLKALAKEQGCTLHALMFTMYHVLIAKYSGANETIIGIPVAGRQHPDIQTMQGMFVNNLPIRNVINGEETIREILRNVDERISNGLLHQDYPFDEMVTTIVNTQNASRNPIFDTMFIYQNMGTTTLIGQDFTLSRYFFDPGYSKFDISMEVFENDKSLKYGIEYNTTLFKKDTILSVQRCFENLVNEILKNPDTQYSRLSLLDTKEANRFTYLFNNDVQTYPKEKSVYHLFEEQAQRTPKSTALEFGSQTMTYEELDNRVNQFALVLKEKGVASQNIVSILLPRSFELVITILGVMKIGGVYVPLDADLPEDRIRYILGHSQCDFLITNSDKEFKVNSDVGSVLPRSITIDKITSSKETLNTDIEFEYNAQDPAYILYTSGTTGKPKGVVVKNTSLTNYICWAAETYIKEKSAKFPLYTSISFDLTVTSIFTPLITGNTIVIYEEEQQEMLIEKVLNDTISTIVKLTPSHLKIIRELHVKSTNSIKRFIIGGEELETSLAKDIYNQFGGQVELYNEYGPTEATVGCMIYKFSPDDTFRTVPIGDPIKNTQIYVLDEYLNPVPVGVRGDLYISGDGLAQGYFKNDVLTNEKFIENPFIEGQKMYRSGDIAVRRSNEALEYIGRSDQQIKINGYRIEIPEIENCLLDHPDIKQATVVCDEVSGEKALHAYYRSVENIKIDYSDLVSFLANRLPYYMIPRSYTYIEKMPLTKNGKIDYKALPVPEFNTNQIEREASENNLEEAILEVWKDIFGTEDISVNDNFFEMGGDSIKAVQISSKLNMKGITLDVKDILTYQTIAITAPYANINLDNEKYDQGFVEGLKALNPIESWFVNQKQPNPNYYNQSVLLNFNEPIHTEVLTQAFMRLINHHDGLRINYKQNENKIWFNEAYINYPFKIEEHKINADDELFEVCTTIKNSMDIENSLLIKAAIIMYPDASEKLFITAHHLVVDGISWRILLDDLKTIYQSLLSGNEPVLPMKTMSLQEWQITLTSLVQKTNFTANEVAYWKAIEEEDFELPYDTETNDWRFKNSRQITVNLDEDQTAHLVKKAHLSYKTNIVTLLSTALSLALQEWINKEEFIIQFENHGRHVENVDVSRTSGWFTAMYPVKLTLIQGTIDDQIKSIKEQLVSVPNNGLGYGISKYMRETELTSNEKLSELRFNYLGQFDQELTNDLFEFSQVFHGSEVGLENILTTKLEINAMVVQEKLQISANYNSKFHKNETISRFLESFLTKLSFIINHTKDQKDIHFTPSDFESVDLEQGELDSLFS
ncbi:non-ribosomal peptide synthetase [Aquimarina mytili]|uniref:Amino acid adenylation domain-containing protein n=1 Tax=Aquimarina mytili TaxID=874423 RepID=A0A937DDD7_9FLAO|nr:non-ribosomal peptide synthetase [Aquimarina mytili]MBL0685916.1 amino acid adenylation domain-containing protein [Aquimarina mytili]